MPKGKMKNMIEIREIIYRLKNGQSQRLINREIGVDRAIVKKIYDLASIHNWLDSASSMPSDAEIGLVWKPKPKTQNHILTPYHENIKEWHNAEYSAVVIHKLLQEKCICGIQVVRRYLSKNFPQLLTPVMVRPTYPGKDMDVDFGYLGLFLDKYGCQKKTWIFSARLRHSRKTYREIVLNQKALTFLLCHIHAFEYFNGVTENVVLDNTKAAIICSTIDNDMVSRSYQELAEYYRFIITPCLPRTPEHKGGVEGDMKYVKRNFLPYFKEKQKQKNIKQSTIADLIEGLKKWDSEVADIHIVQGLGRSPQEIFKSEEEKVLRPLPTNRWELISWSQCTVRRDWRIMHECAYYSVPYKLVNKTVQVATSSSFIRIFYENQEVAFHEKAKEKWEYKRKTEHAPPLQEGVLQCSREGLLLQAEKIGSYTYQVAHAILSHPSVDKLRPVRCLLALGNKYSQERLEKACQRASTYKMYSYANVKNILENKLDMQPNNIPNTSKIVQMPQFRFRRDPSEYKNAIVVDEPIKKAFLERLEDAHPYSKHGNAMARTVWDMLMADQLAEEEKKEENDN